MRLAIFPLLALWVMNSLAQPSSNGGTNSPVIVIDVNGASEAEISFIQNELSRIGIDSEVAADSIIILRDSIDPRADFMRTIRDTSSATALNAEAVKAALTQVMKSPVSVERAPWQPTEKTHKRAAADCRNLIRKAENIQLRNPRARYRFGWQHLER